MIIYIIVCHSIIYIIVRRSIIYIATISDGVVVMVVGVCLAELLTFLPVVGHH